jgi:outer membrane lipoprotein SlyB
MGANEGVRHLNCRNHRIVNHARSLLRSAISKENPVRIIAISTLLSALMLAPAAAGERLGDGAMGALAGAVVAGPVGLVAGGVIGYAAGPNISERLGINKRRHHRHVRHVYR